MNDDPRLFDDELYWERVQQEEENDAANLEWLRSMVDRYGHCGQ